MTHPFNDSAGRGPPRQRKALGYDGRGMVNGRLRPEAGDWEADRWRDRYFFANDPSAMSIARAAAGERSEIYPSN